MCSRKIVIDHRKEKQMCNSKFELKASMPLQLNDGSKELSFNNQMLHIITIHSHSPLPKTSKLNRSNLQRNSVINQFHLPAQQINPSVSFKEQKTNKFCRKF